MSSPILATRTIIPPPRSRLVLRRRLLDRLEAGLPRRLTLISAAAGFGKTALASAWARASSRPVAWLALDEADVEPQRFLADLIGAIQTISPGFGTGILGRIQSGEPPPIEVALTELVNKIAQAPMELALVLDDYHVVDSTQVDAALTFLIDHLPPQLHLVIATREEPRLALARYRSRGELTELREADLRFTDTEAREFLDEVMGIQLTEDAVRALQARTEGWIVGLQLAALSMRGRSDPDRFIESFTGTNRFVLDYLLEEVLHRQPRAIQDFLLGTSILARMCAGLCDAVLQETPASGQDTLEALERANLFVVALDDDRRWYRYHELFAGLLRARLARTQPERVAGLHRRASEWLAANDEPAEAVVHALAVEDWPRAAEIIERHADEWPIRSGVTAVLRWLEAFPAAIRLKRPALGLVYAWHLFMTNQLDRAEAFLRDLAPTVRASPEVLGEVVAIRVMVAANRHDMAAVEALADEADAQMPADAVVPRSRYLISLGVARSETGGDLEGARRAFREALELGETVAPPSFIGNAPLPLTALAYLAEIEWLEGHLRAAASMYQHGLELVARWGGRSSIPLNLVQLGRASLLYERDDLDGAATALEEAVRAAESWGNARLLAPALALTATVARARDRWDEARTAILRAAQVGADAPASALIRTALAVHELGFAAAVRDWEAIARWQEQYDSEASALPARLDGAFAVALATSWIALHLDRREEASLVRARSVLEPALARSQAEGLGLHVTRLRILDAVALHELGSADAAMAACRDVLQTAAPEGYVRSFLDVGKPAEAVLRRTVERRLLDEPTAGYARRILARFRPPTSAQPAPSWSEPLQGALTERELDVLRLIALGLSNREIGERLFLAESTVKGHARILFDKLGVRRRTEAVARARGLGLV